jgi:methyl-accepting chemotaxis protein PixJ
MFSTNVVNQLASEYDMTLVILSYIVAVCASFTALYLATQITASKTGNRTTLLLTGAVAMGLGIWCMHFIAALAFMLPITVSYDVMLTVASVVPAVIASWIALYIVTRPSMGIGQMILGGLLMGPGIGGMHYTGMWAMKMDATMSFDPKLFGLSLVVAIVVSIVALWLAFHLRGGKDQDNTLLKIVSALVMGAAVVGMHFTGQAATHIVPNSSAMISSAPKMADGTMWLAVAIGAGTIAILVLVIMGAGSEDTVVVTDAKNVKKAA